MPTKAEHRARIRSTIIMAVADLNHFNWEEDDDALLDFIDQWLELKENRGRTITAVKGTLDQAMANPDN